MLIMCLKFFGINTSDDLSLSSPYWLLGIGDGFQSWTHKVAHCVSMLLSCRSGVGVRGGWCEAMIQTTDHEPKWVSYFENVILPALWTPFLLISQKVTAHCSGNKRFYVVSTPYSPCVSSDSQKWLPRLSVPPSFQYIFYILLNLFSSWICMKYLRLGTKKPSINQSICIGYHN